MGTLVSLTEHAYEQSKKRFRWKKETARKMAQRALDEGLTHAEAKGSLKKYLNTRWLKHRNCDAIRIYGEDAYFFSGNRLITLYRIPQKLMGKVRDSKNARAKNIN